MASVSSAIDERVDPNQHAVHPIELLLYLIDERVGEDGGCGLRPAGRGGMSADAEPEMRERLGRVLALLQATPFPLDLVDDPARTGQWLVTLGNLNQAVALLRPQPAAGLALAAPTAYETRG